MRSGGNITRGIGFILILAGVIGAILLLLQSGPKVSADLRLDDYETSWPNHIEVQNAGVDLVTQVNDNVLDLDVSIRKDRSTIEIVAPADTPLADVDALVTDAVSQDAENSITDPSVEQLTNSLNALLSDLDLLEQDDTADAAEISELADQAVRLRSQLANKTVRTEAARSRFVPLQPASKETPSFPLAQWVLAGLVVAGGASIVTTARYQ